MPSLNHSASTWQSLEIKSPRATVQEFSVSVSLRPPPRSFNRVNGGNGQIATMSSKVYSWQIHNFPTAPFSLHHKSKTTFGIKKINSLRVHNTTNYMGSSLSYTISMTPYWYAISKSSKSLWVYHINKWRRSPIWISRRMLEDNASRVTSPLNLNRHS